MQCELVKTISSDGLRLDGAWHAAAAAPRFQLDAALCLHGVGSNFYSASLFEYLAAELLDCGLPVLRVNTRGHDGVSTASGPGGPRRQGAAFERVGDCRLDIDAWLSFLEQRDCRRVVVIGHSLGAIKGLYSHTHEPPHRMAAMIAISPPRLSYAAFAAADSGPQFAAAIADAQAAIAAGKTDDLLAVEFPFPMLISAANYVDKYGPNEHYNILRFVGQITAPTLFVYGARELATGGIAFAGLPEALAELKYEHRRPDCCTVPGANHLYAGRYPALLEILTEWLQGHFGR